MRPSFVCVKCRISGSVVGCVIGSGIRLISFREREEEPCVSENLHIGDHYAACGDRRILWVRQERTAGKCNGGATTVFPTGRTCFRARRYFGAVGSVHGFQFNTGPR